jgi:hypothetical protein
MSTPEVQNGTESAVTSMLSKNEELKKSDSKRQTRNAAGMKSSSSRVAKRQKKRTKKKKQQQQNDICSMEPTATDEEVDSSLQALHSALENLKNKRSKCSKRIGELRVTMKDLRKETDSLLRAQTQSILTRKRKM